MKRALIFALMTYVLSVSADELRVNQQNERDVIRVATALDHLSVLEFGEPVTMAAAGSSAFQIERHDDKVFIKPLKAGASTDLFVWTVSHRFTYELEPAGEVRNMSFAVDSRVYKPQPVGDKNSSLNEIADMMLTSAFLGAERVDNREIKDVKGRVTVRIQHVFCSKNSLYIHYSVRNLGERPYRVLTPTVQQLLPRHSAVSLPVLRYTQLTGGMVHKLGKTQTLAISIRSAATQKEDTGQGEETQGVVVIRRQVEDEPSVFRLTFGSEGNRQVHATLVL
jgi:hypothetical protein